MTFEDRFRVSEDSGEIAEEIRGGTTAELNGPFQEVADIQRLVTDSAGQLVHELGADRSDFERKP